MTVYKDLDKTAYLIYDRHTADPFPCDSTEKQRVDRCLYVVKLSDDYLSFTDTYKRIDAAAWREAPCIAYKDGYYYIVTSGLTGWKTNQAKAFRTKRLLDNWEEIGDPCVDDFTNTTFNTQGSNIFTVQNSDTQIIMLERHNTDNFQKCSYVWLPIEFNNDNTISLHYKKEWELALRESNPFVSER